MSFSSFPKQCAVFALAVMTVTAPLSAFAAEVENCIGLVMSKLPPASSKDYKTLRKLAGKATGQALTMTHSEVWNVPADRVEELLAAATAKGVTVTKLDATWNHALAPMKEGSDMTVEQKNMMSMSMDSKAAMGMSLMNLPQANVMEYALTKNMEGTAKDEPAPTVVIPLNATTVITARRTSIKSTGDGFIWHGEVEGTGDGVTLMWWPGGRLTGTVNYRGHMFEIKNMGGTMHGVVELNPNGLPDEHEPMNSEQKQKMNMRDDPLVKQGDASMMMKALSSPLGDAAAERRDTRNLEDAPLSHDARQLARNSIAGKKIKRGRKQQPVTITLLVAYTKQAASHYTNIATDLIALAVEEANQSFINSGIGNVRFKVVHTHETDYVEAGSHFDHVFQLLQKNDGVMDEIPKLRDQYKADLAVLVVHDPKGCGLAAKVAAEADRAFAVVHHECAATTYSLGHEVGHLIGARHDLALDDSTVPFPDGHGFVNGTEWRTMMSYKESCNGCPRLPVWSNPNVNIKGVAAGNATSNNARVLMEQAARVAKFR